MAVQVTGSINVDLIQSVDALPKPGETVLARRSARLPGGKGANQAVAAARMGAATRMIAAVGADDAGRWMAEQLSAEGIDIRGVATLADSPTGTAYIAVDSAGENQIIVASGANAGLSPDRIGAMMPDTRVLLAQLEIPVETVRACFTAPDARSCIRILNAAPALPEVAALFGETDILIVNQHELALYLDRAEPIRDVRDALAARDLLTREDQAVVVTLGAQGAVAVRRQSHFHAPGLPVEPVDTIGAGDCFCGALAALLDAGQALEEALPFANAAAALCTQKQGAIPAMPSRAEVAALVSRRSAPTKLICAPDQDRIGTDNNLSLNPGTRDTWT